MSGLAPCGCVLLCLEHREAVRRLAELQVALEHLQRQCDRAEAERDVALAAADRGTDRMLLAGAVGLAVGWILGGLL